MIRPDQIPPEVVEAAARADYENWRDLNAVRGDTLEWEDIEEEVKEEHRAGVRASFAAAINAWPGIQHKPYWDFRTNEKHTELILPVPQKEKGGQ